MGRPNQGWSLKETVSHKNLRDKNSTLAGHRKIVNVTVKEIDDNQVDLEMKNIEGQLRNSKNW